MRKIKTSKRTLGQKGFAHPLLLVVAILVIAAIGFTGWRIYKDNQLKHSNNSSYSYNNGGSGGGSSNVDYAFAGGGGDSSTKNLPACSASTALDHVPLAGINTIEGLGHMFGEHIIPVQADHIYLYPSSSAPQQDVYAPGNVTLIQVVAADHIGGESSVGTDYTYYFSSCKSELFQYGHVRVMSSKIQDALKSIKPNCGAPGSLVQNCVYQDVNLKLTSGEVIGTAAGQGRGMDFSAVDIRTPALNFINKQAITGGTLADSYFHTVCGLDYFTGPLKSQLYGKLVTKNAGANGIPACGSVMQDKPGTSQGNWYRPGLTNTSQGNGLTKIMALVHSNLDPTQVVLSAGSALLPSPDYGAQIVYTPTGSGYVNRDPADMKPDGHVYCIEGQEDENHAYAHVDLQLTNAATIETSYATGSCATTPALGSSPVTFVR